MEKELITSMLDKSEEAFLMAIEIYNKPTINYRLEGFSFFICNAWELLLKAKMLKQNKKKVYPKSKGILNMQLHIYSHSRTQL